MQIALIPGVLPTDEILTELALAQSRTVADDGHAQMLELPQDPKSVQSVHGPRDGHLAKPISSSQFTVKASSADDAVARVGRPGEGISAGTGSTG